VKPAASRNARRDIDPGRLTPRFSSVTAGAVERGLQCFTVHAVAIAPSVAIHAKSHRQALLLPCVLEVLHVTVACATFDADPRMRSVIEIGEIGELRDTRPRNGLRNDSGVELEPIVEALRSVQCAHRVRDDPAHIAPLLRRSPVFIFYRLRRRGDESVAIHADVCARHSCEPPCGSCGVAVPAPNLEVPGVQAM
jgi:hypothetical protein